MSRKALGVCAYPGCPELTTNTRCPAHARAARAPRDKERGTFRERGYDREYDVNKRRVLREEDTCWLCLDPVDKTLSGRDPRGPSVDHVKPRAEGGGNDRANLRLSHLRCNLARAGRRAE